MTQQIELIYRIVRYKILTS